MSWPDPIVSDNIDEPASLTVTCSPSSGSMLGDGQTTVLCVVRDRAGNVATCSFNVVVGKDTLVPSL